MATQGLAAPRRATTKTYGGPGRATYDSDIFGEPLSPKQAHAAWGSNKSRGLEKTISQSNVGLGGRSKMTKSPGLRKDEFDFPSSDDEKVVPVKKKTTTTVAKNNVKSKAKSVFDMPSSGEEKIVKKTKIKESSSSVAKAAVKRSKYGYPTSSKSAIPEPPNKPPTMVSTIASHENQRKKTDIYDLPDSGDETPKRKVSAPQPKRPAMAVTKAKTFQLSERPKISPVSGRTRQKTPALDGPREVKPSKTTLPTRPLRAQAPTSLGKVTSKPGRTTQPISKRKLLKVGSSAPAILSRMVEEATSTSESPPEQPLSPSPVSSNGVAMQTPSPRFSPARDTINTPRHAPAWEKLLEESESFDSPSDLPVADLRLVTAKKRAVVSMPRSSSDVTGMAPNKRRKLIDTLKVSATVTKYEDDSMEDDDESDDSSRMDLDVPRNTKQPAPRIPRITKKATYAQLRSHLAEQTEEDILDALMEGIAQPFGGPRQLSQKEDFDLDSDSDEDMEEGHPKSVHDLRAAGSKKRLLGDIEALVSGVEGQGSASISARRSDLLDLAKQCLEPSIVNLILDHSLDRPLLTSFGNSTDSVFDFLAASVLGLIAKETQQLQVLRGINRSGGIARLFELLDIDQDITRLVKERRFKMSIIAQRRIAAFKEPLLESGLWSSLKPTRLTAQLASLRALELLVRRTRELGGDELPIDDKTINRLITILEDSSVTNIQRDLVFSILESSSIGTTISSRGPWSIRSFERLSRILSTIFSLDATAQKSRNLALRLSINLSHNNERACALLATPTTVQSLLAMITNSFTVLQSSQSTADDPSILDELILTLGAMINLAEISETARACVVAPGTAVLEQLVRIFCDHNDATIEATSIESSRSNVPYGYLALLLINLCQTDRLRSEILSVLPGQSQLRGLITAAEEFIRMHQETDREMFDSTTEGNAQTEYTRRLMRMVSRLKETAMMN
ncbi:hypothetical protein BT63DRAFT_251187 [Microthyrium microscopicum]|uniref:Wings apart-like protein C-terminal domain-containing protein n=1 Tax=Microthyrium microscopicum TaxID=703497 RepID=A0A6A6UCP4_9PEZI|nr:hypothetical protein BT63DRAFT_251187 [Microthyrium microscopicum]